MKGKKLKFAIVGCGAIGRRHAIQATMQGSLVGVCDIDKEKACSLADEHKTRAYSRVEDLLYSETKPDIVSICTPNGLHAVQTIQALEAGCHVICEKPMALFPADAKEMIKAEEKAGRHLFVVKQNRFNPPVAYVKHLLEQGSLGRICGLQVNGVWSRTGAYYKDSWHGTRELDGGILFTQFSHFIDLLYWMFGDVKEAYAFSGNFFHRKDIAFEDAVTASLRFDSGIVGSLFFTINSYGKNMEGSLLVIGEKGTVRIGGQYLNVLEYAELEEKDLSGPPPASSSPANDYGYYRGSMSNHDRMYAHVADVILNGAINLFTGHEGLKTVEIIEKIYNAAK